MKIREKEREGETGGQTDRDREIREAEAEK